jgi:hypothetical protein
MGIVDFILNLAGLLLWLNWRSQQMAGPPPTVSLAATLKPTEPERSHRWVFLAALPILLFLRSVFYWQLGPAIEWTPRLPLGALVFFFRSDLFSRMLLFSLLSFGLTWVVFYSWLFLLSALNGRTGESDPCHKLIQLHLGWLSHAPTLLQFLLPFLLAALFWLALGPLFVALHLMPKPPSFWHTGQQSIIIALSLVMLWRYLFTALLGICFLNTYVYLGSSPLLNFVVLSSRNLLRPVQWCRLGKLDFAPLVGIVLVWLLTDLFSVKALDRPSLIQGLFEWSRHAWSKTGW